MSNELVPDDVVRLPLQQGELLLPGEGGPEPDVNFSSTLDSDFLFRAAQKHAQDIEESILGGFDHAAARDDFTIFARYASNGPVFHQPPNVFVRTNA